jgi:hypothetical protein
MGHARWRDAALDNDRVVGTGVGICMGIGIGIEDAVENEVGDRFGPEVVWLWPAKDVRIVRVVGIVAVVHPSTQYVGSSLLPSGTTSVPPCSPV